MTPRRIADRLCLVALVLLAATLPAAPASGGGAAGRVGITRGICVVLGDTEAKLALDLARSTEAIVYVQLQKDADVLAARRAVGAADLGSRGGALRVLRPTKGELR